MQRAFRLFLGVVVGDIAGLGVWALTLWLNRQQQSLSSITFGPSLLLIPALVGFVAAWIWRPLGPERGFTLLGSLFATVIGLLAGWMFFGEGVICLIIISPILFINVAAGALLGRLWFARKDDRLNALAIPVLAAAVLVEPSLRSPHSGVVTDEIVINAPPEKVWPHVQTFEPIAAPPNFWLFSLGLPYPVSTTNAGNHIGADRACIFSGNAVFKEKIVELEPNRLLTFDIVEQPPDPELIGHLNAHRGQFELRDDRDGTTTLIGRTWYTLHVRPALYFDWWTEHIFRAVHLRVMENVKTLAERP